MRRVNPNQRASMRSNREVYGSLEFDAWTTRSELEPAEAYVIKTFLNPRLRTIEAGAGGGRIVHAMHKMGFSDLYGFDYVPEMIFSARGKTPDPRPAIGFFVQDAAAVALADGTFDQIVYLQQVLCFLEAPELRRRAIHEAFRILRRGGTALFSFLCLDERRRRPAQALFLKYLWALRALCGSSRNRQLSPWLRLGGRPNWSALLDRPPYVYWYRMEEAAQELIEGGFAIRAIATEAQLIAGRMLESRAELSRSELRGHLYVVCGK